MSQSPGGGFNIKMPSNQYGNSHCGDKMISWWLSYLHYAISYTGKRTEHLYIESGSRNLTHCGPVRPYGHKDLTAPSHYLSQCQFLISDVLWHSPESTFTMTAQIIIFYNENYTFNIIATALMSQCINSSPPSATYMCQWIGSAVLKIMACHLFNAK